MKLLFLFDLDGTLIQGAGGGRRAMGAALRDVHGIQNGLDGIATAGKTDPGIFREALRAHGRAAEDGDGTSARLREVYLDHLRREIAAAPGKIAPGVLALLGRLGEWPDAHLALGTGNFEEGARLKLAPHDLNRFFPTGGFGTDAEDRNEMIRIGIKKAERHYRTPFDRVIVVGDTPLDVACARANGAHCVAVATGGADYAELASHEPDLLLRDFSDTERVFDEFKAFA